MMKKIFALVLLLVLGKLSYAQYPITQTLGSDSTIVISKGALQSRLINVTYTDTTAANLQRIRQYPGAQIATTTGGLNLWVRNANATAWIPVATGSGNNIYTIDGTLLGNRTLTGAGYSLTFNQLSKLLFNADSTTINTDQATISNNGVSTLSVKGATGRMFLVDTTAPADERIYELKSSNGEFFISILNDAQTSNDSAFLITSASRVGINTLNPDSTLKVGGGVNILGGLRVGNLPTSPGTKQLRINAQGQFSVTDTLIDAGGTVTSIATNNGSGITGGTITTTGTLAIDTTNVIATKASVSGGLAGKLNISDTAAMLAPYLRAIDTASLSNRINLKVNISDTATMLGNYLNNVGYGLSKAGQVASADSATLSAYYLRRKDSLTVTNPLGYVTQKILADTAAAIRSSDLGGTVTSVATNNGTGITGGTITTSGTLAIDTLLVSTRAWRQKGVDSVAALANTKISGSLISGYLTKATGSLTIDTSQLYQSSGLIGIGTTSPTQKLQVSGNAYVNGQLFAGDTALSTYQVEGILSTPYVLGRKAVDNTLSTEARPTGIQGHVVGRGSIANRLQGGTFYATTDSASTANSTGSLRASNSWSAHNGSGTLANAWGSYNIVQNKTTGTITNAYGSVSGVENRGATSTINKLHGTTTEIWNNYGGTIDTAFGQVISIYNNNAASNIGAVYGLSIGKGLVTPTGGTHYWKNSGTIGTSYGLYLDTSIDVGTTKYSIFSNSNSNSYFKGKLGVGTTSPDSAFQVATGALFQRGVRMSALPQAPGTKALRIDASGTISYADTLIDAGGTVTSVATNNGTGITGGTITTTGTLAIDTLLISTRAWRQKGVDSLQANINLKLNISDTASMLANYITGPQTFSGYMARFSGGGTIDTSRIFQNNGLVGINTTGPSYSLDVLGTARVTSNSYLATSSGVVGIGTTSADSLLTVEQGAWVKRGLRLSGLPTGVGTKSLRVDANGTVSLADTLANGISGTGTTNYIPKFTSSSAIGNSIISASSTLITNEFGTSNLYFGQSGSTRFGFASGTATLAFGTGLPLVLGTFDGQPLVFGTNNTEYMRLTSGGSLGIGTSAPAVKLDVVGDGTFSGYVNANVYNLAGLTGGGALSWTTNTLRLAQDSYFQTLQFWTNGSERMRLDASGNLGLGISNPAYRLDVNGYIRTALGLVGTSGLLMYGDASSPTGMLLSTSGNLGLGVTPQSWFSGYKVLQVNNFSVASYLNSSVYLGHNYYTNTSGNDIYRNNGFATNYAQFNGSHVWYNAPSGTAGNAISFTQAMTLDASGNLGIGTTSPQQKLHIAGDVQIGESSGGEKLRFVGASNKYNFQLGKQINGDNIFEITPSTAAGGTTFSTPAFVVTYDSKIGIGTTSPDMKLEVIGSGSVISGNAYAISRILNSKTAGEYKGLGFGYMSSENTGILYAETYSGANNMAFWTYSGSAWGERMRITSGGDVGIGTTSPAVELALYNSSTPRLHLQNSTSGITSTDGLQIALSGSDGYLWNWENGNVLFATNNSERMRITSGGELLINTTSDAGDYKLQVNGNVRASNSYSSTTSTNNTNIGTSTFLTDYNFIGSDAYWGIKTTTTGKDFAIDTYNSGTPKNVLTITQAGNVGIGTTSPNTNLEVYQTGTAGNNYVEGTVKVGGSTSSLGAALSYASQNSGYVSISNLNNSGGANARISFGFGAISSGLPANNVMTINQSGNVGIGISSPNAKLEVNGNMYFSTNTNFLLFGTSASTNPYIQGGSDNGLFIGTGNLPRLTITSGGNVLVGTTTDAGYKFDVAGSLRNTTSAYFATSSGSVGIGTTSPDASTKLQVESSSSSSLRVVSSAASGGDLYITSVNGSGESKIDKQGAAGPLTFYNNGSERMRLTSGGELLINTTTDAGAYYLQVNGDVYASAYYESSDLRLKNVLSERKGSDGINTIAFKWKDGRDSLTHIGYAAQQVEKVLPDAVKTNPNGYKTINYDEVQSLKIANLEQEIAELKKIIKQLIDKK